MVPPKCPYQIIGKRLPIRWVCNPFVYLTRTCLGENLQFLIRYKQLVAHLVNNIKKLFQIFD